MKLAMVGLLAIKLREGDLCKGPGAGLLGLGPLLAPLGPLAPGPFWLGPWLWFCPAGPAGPAWPAWDRIELVNEERKFNPKEGLLPVRSTELARLMLWELPFCDVFCDVSVGLEVALVPFCGLEVTWEATGGGEGEPGMLGGESNGDSLLFDTCDNDLIDVFKWVIPTSVLLMLRPGWSMIVWLSSSNRWGIGAFVYVYVLYC